MRAYLPVYESRVYLHVYDENLPTYDESLPVHEEPYLSVMRANRSGPLGNVNGG